MNFDSQRILCRCKPVPPPAGIEGECMEWQQSCSKSGYPRLTIKDAPSQYAHGCVWIAANGPVSAGLFVWRDCRNKRCCTLGHMRLVTRGEQNRLAAETGAWRGAKRIAACTKAARSRKNNALTLGKAATIFLNAGKTTIYEDAKAFGVSPGLVSKVRRAECWIGAVEELTTVRLARPLPHERIDVPKAGGAITLDWERRRQGVSIPTRMKAYP